MLLISQISFFRPALQKALFVGICLVLSVPRGSAIGPPANTQTSPSSNIILAQSGTTAKPKPSQVPPPATTNTTASSRATTQSPENSRQSNADRLYGKITTVDGETYEGFIRWDKNETHWFDILNGNKELDRRQQRDIRRRARENEKRYDNNDWGNWSISLGSNAESGIRFGNISRLEALGDDEVLLKLKNGEEVHLTEGSSDIGTDIRELLVEDIDEGELELAWDDLESVDFMAAPAKRLA